jgi:uncharacterized Zn-binding protein involved in type VI secretion
MPAAARLSDATATDHPGMIVGGCATVLINRRPAARVKMPPTAGPHSPNRIATGSTKVLIGGQPAARQFDKTECGATIMTGSPDVLIGD